MPRASSGLPWSRTRRLKLMVARSSQDLALANFRDRGLIRVERQKITLLDQRALRR